MQDARKSAGFAVSDRIELAWTAEGELADAVREHAAALGSEVLATTVTEGAPADAAAWSAGDGGELGLRLLGTPHLRRHHAARRRPRP